MTFVYVLVFILQGAMELKTYDTLESCEAASIASDKELKRIYPYYADRRNLYVCLPKPA